MRAIAPTTEQQVVYVAIWTKAVETQMHFNEMSVKSRQLGLAFVAAALGVGLVLLSRKEDFSFSLGPVLLHVSVILLLAACVAVLAVRQLDLGVYHRMLRGAVTFGEDFEQHYMRRIFDLEKGMTQAISHFSRFDDAKKQVNAAGRYEYSGEKAITAEHKIRRFYRYIAISLVAAAIALFAVQNIEHRVARHAKVRSASERAETTNATADIKKGPAISPPTVQKPGDAASTARDLDAHAKDSKSATTNAESSRSAGGSPSR